MTNNPERFPAGTTADARRFNQWTAAVVDRQQALVAQTERRLERAERLATMNAAQIQANADYLSGGPSPPTGNRLRVRSELVSGNVQHDVRYGQVTQSLSAYQSYPNQRIRVSHPVPVGGTKQWARTYLETPNGEWLDAASGDPQQVWIRAQLPTTRRVNTLIWEPFVALSYDLAAVRIFTSSGETNLNLLASSGIETLAHGPQRFFFPEVEAWGAEVELTGSPNADNQLAVGCWKFELGRSTAAAGAGVFVYQLSESVLTTVTPYYEGHCSVALNQPANGQVTVTLTTPASGPTSVVRRLEYT
jgi:hypothetical protein